MRGANPSPSPKRRRRQALFAVSVLSTLLVAQELLLRFLFPIPPVHGFNRIHYQMLAGTSPTLRQSLRRGLAYVDLRFISRPDGFDHRHRLNLFGFRGSDFSIDRPADRRRVIVLGDSVAEGQGASESATIAAHLSRHWPDAEVLNLGVVAADLPRLAHLAHDAIPLLRPTDVVLVLSANDLPAPPLDPSRLGPSRSFPRNTTPPAFPHAFALVVRILSQQPIYRRWPRPTLPFFPAVPAPTNPWTHVTSPPADIDPDLLQAMAAGQLNPWLAEQADAIPGMLAHDFSLGGSAAPYLRTIAAYCRQVQARLLVAYVPFCGVVHRRYADVQIQLGMAPAVAEALPSDPIYRRQNHHLDEVCARLRLPLVDTTEPLQAADQAGTLQYWPYDTHPTPQGYATIAQAIASAAARAD
jgi:lysophospholipase L1-like esterase